jgi:dihydrofolate reductase
MRKVTLAAFVSLDGIMQAPGGPKEDPTGDFKYGGWTVAYWDDTIGQATAESFGRPFDLLLGRKTYEIFAAHWPYIDVDSSSGTFDAEMAAVASSFNRATKYVATRSKPELTWQNSQWLGEDAVSTVARLKAGDGPDLLIQGSSDFSQSLIAADLIDEYRLLIYPLVLGKGRRLFGDGAIPLAFKLTRSVASPAGVLIASYERSGDIQTGSFALDTPTEAEVQRRKNLH